MPPATEPVDFLIITALEEERDAVLAKLPGWRKLDRDGTGAHTYYEAYVTTTRGDGAVYRLIVTMLSAMGPLSGAIKAGAVIQRWNPEHVLMVGIAGGVSKETTPGNVLVAEQVADYTLGKVRNSTPRETRWVSYLPDANLFDAAKNFPNGWEVLVTCPRPDVGVPKRQFGVIASGGDVVDSKKQIAIYRQDWPKLIGVEMEGGGVAAGLHNDIERPRFLMVRGVSDLADTENNAAMKAAWRVYACDVAAAYAIGLLRDGPVVQTSRRPGSATAPGDSPSQAARVLLRAWNRTSATDCVLEQLRNFGGLREYGLGHSWSEGGDVSHEVHDFLYVKYIEHAAYIAVAVTRPDPPDDCHAAAPSLSFVEFVEKPQGWELGTVHVNALHAGAWGQPPSTMRVMDIGYNMFAIMIEGGFTNQGYTACHTSIYTTITGEFREVFATETFADDSGTGRGSETSWSADIQVVRNGTSFYDLVVHRKGRSNGKRFDERQVYKFDGRAYVPA